MSSASKLPRPWGTPGRLGLPDGHATGPAIGERLPDFELPDGAPHMRRLVLRKLRRNPLGFLRFVLWNLRVELAAWRRRRSSRISA